jgi:hypothetical protein
VTVQLCGIQQGLRGNASLVQTYAAEIRLFNNGSLQTTLGCTFRTQISAGTASDYNQIKLFHFYLMGNGSWGDLFEEKVSPNPSQNLFIMG